LRFFNNSVKIKEIKEKEIAELMQTCFTSKDLDSLNLKIEEKRKELIKDKSLIGRIDFGTGSEKSQTVKEIARKSLSTPQQCAFLQHLGKYAHSMKILELGTSFGISTAYLACSNNDVKVITMEGDPSIGRMAQKLFDVLQLDKIHLVQGNFDITLKQTLLNHGPFDMVYIDGNHTYEATREYFDTILPYVNKNGIIILDDIHWSEGMEKAWNSINETNNYLSIDLFHFGLVFTSDFQTNQYVLWPGWRWFK